MSLHRGRMCYSNRLWCLYVFLLFFQFVYCIASFVVKNNLKDGNLLESVQRNQDRDNEKFMIEKLLANDNLLRYENLDNIDNDDKKRFIKKNNLENEKPIIEKLLSMKELFTNKDSVDLDRKKILSNKNIFENKEDGYQSHLKKIFYDNSRIEKENINANDVDDDSVIKKRLFKKNVLEKIFAEENLLRENILNDIDENFSEVKKRLLKKNSIENEDENMKYKKKSTNKNIEDEEIDNGNNELSKRIYKKNIYYANEDPDNDETELKKRFFKKNEYNDDVDTNDPEFKKRHTKKNAYIDDDSKTDDPEFKKRQKKKNAYVDDDSDTDDPEFKKRHKKKNKYNDDDDDTSDPEFKKRQTKKNEYNDDDSDTNDPEFKKRHTKKNEYIGDDSDTDEPEVKKRHTKKSEYIDEDADTNDPEFKKRHTKKNEHNDDGTDDNDPVFKKRLSSKNEYNDDDADPEVKKRQTKKNKYYIHDDNDDTDPEFKKRFYKKNEYDDDSTDNSDSDYKKRCLKKRLHITEEIDNNDLDIDEQKRESKKIIFKKNNYQHNQRLQDSDSDAQTIENILHRETFEDNKRNNNLQNEFEGELPILKLPPQAMIHDVVLDRNDTYHLYWQVDYKSESVRMEVHSRAVSSHPWISIGFSNRGVLPGGDVCVFWIDWKNLVHFQNAFIDSDSRLMASPTQECRNFRYRMIQGVLKLTFTRRFDTCEPNHYIIERGTTHIVWSWGEGPLYDLDGVLAEGDSNGMVRVELLKPILTEPSLEGTEEIDITSNSAKIPAEETTYWCTVHKLPERFEEKHHILKFGPKIQKRNEDIVHHMEVFHCEQHPDFQVPLYEGPCHADDRPKEIDACKRVLAAWAMGALPFTYPEEAGLPFGGEDFNPFVMIEVHYNNPSMAAGRTDSSGMTLTYSRQLRRHDAAIMELGLEYTAKMAVPPGMKTFFLEGYCIPECTAVGLDPEGIFIFGSQLHTHLTGVRAWTKHLRGDDELPELNRDNHYSTHFQEIRRLPYLVHVLPGDALITTCQHTTLDRAKVTVGGFAISDEMCVNYVHYYPKSDLEVCKSSVDSRTLKDYFERMNRLELQNTSPKLDWRENYQAIQWSPLRGNFLQALYNEATLSMQCNKSSGERFPGYWENKPLPSVVHPLPIPKRECNLKEHFRLNEEIIIV